MNKYSDFLKTSTKLSSFVRQGVERECLRVDANNKLSVQDHPKALGSKLTHPFITTDYSENLLEYITGVFKSEKDLLSNLEDMHNFTYQNLEKDEYIWPWSMPAIVPENEDDIKVAHYGKSNVGKLKELYRIGLGHRYGKSMQSIAGVHYNFSLSDEFWNELKISLKTDESIQQIKDDAYFHLIRNYRRYSYILSYLFGATPVVHESFLKNKKHKLEKLGNKTFGKEFATSLRMGGLGYTSNAQKEISICYNALPTYIKTLEAARLQSYPEYEKIGLKDESGHKQLNTNLLQIDNEFYSTIRPKNIAKSCESALGALYDRGIEYIEVRLLDVNPFSPVGIDLETMRFLHSFLLFCLFKDSPIITSSECHQIDENFSRIVNDGRNPNLTINCQGKELPKDECILSLLEEIKGVAKLLGQEHIEALGIQKEKIKNPTLLPSSKIMKMLESGEAIDTYMASIAKLYKAAGMDQETPSHWNEVAKKSLLDQEELEKDSLGFDDFLVDYFEQIKIKFKEDNA